MFDFTLALKAAMSTIGGLFSPVSKIIKQRKAINTPLTIAKPFSDHLLEKALKLLSIVGTDASVWARLQNQVVSPTYMNRAYIAEWLSKPEVVENLVSSAKRQILSQDPDTAALDRLKELYVEVSGEHERYAEPYILASLAFLVGSVRVDIKDRGIATLVETGFAAVLDKLDDPSDVEKALFSCR